MKEESKNAKVPQCDKTTDVNNALATGICRHNKHKVAEREFYVNQKNKFSGTRIICKKCGANIFIKDKKYGVYAFR